MKKRHTHTALLILAASVTIVVVALYAYAEHAIYVSVDRAAAVRQKVRTETANKSREQEVLKAYEETASDWDRLKTFFVPADQVVRFIETVEAIGPKAGCTVDISAIDTDPLDGTPPGSIGSVRARVSASGSWASVMRTLVLAESLPYRSSLSNVSLNGGQSGTGKESKAQWNLSFNVEASLIQPAPAAASTP